MPWTFAHPAAVLPLRRFCPRYLNFPALMTGALMPDLGYYIPGADFATHAHSFQGSVEVCLPAGLAVLCVFLVLRKPLCFCCRSRIARVWCRSPRCRSHWLSRCRWPRMSRRALTAHLPSPCSCDASRCSA